MNKKWNFIWPTFLAGAMIIGMLVGFQLRETTWSKKPIREKTQYNILDEILELVQVKYVDTVDQNKIINKLIENLVTELDPHSFFISARDLQSVNESLEGNFEGIGIEFYVLNDTIIVVSPISGGPSEELGIVSGDKIIKINDSLVAGIGITNRDVINQLRGDKGTKVKVSIDRNQTDELLDFMITRDKIPIFSVDVGYMVDDETGYIRINRFSANTYNEFKSELSKLVDMGMEKLIIDLRQNPGGYLNAATMIADELIGGKKLLVYTEGKAYQRKEYTSSSGGIFEDGDLAVLIDEGSASASEILAGAIQDWDRGTVIGRRSFGKGLVQEQYSLKDGSALRLTVARYYTPSGRSIQKPYDSRSDYNNEIVERFEHGEYITKDSISFPDSLKYFTSEGKVVYGGGGIMPDIFMPLDTSWSAQYVARIRRYIPEYIYDYFSRTQDQYAGYMNFHDFNRSFTIPDAVYDEFLDHAKEAGFKLDRSEANVVKKEIKTVMKAYLARQLWRNEGFYPIINEIDRPVQKAKDVLEGSSLQAAE